MYDGSLKAVQNIEIGDQLIGDDGEPRNILSTTTGREKMYQINQSNGISYTVNQSHILSLIDSSEYKRRQAPLGIKISDKGFGKDRRYPIVNKWFK